MNYDKFGRAICSEQELANELYRDPEFNIGLVHSNETKYAESLKKYFISEWPLPVQYTEKNCTVEEFDNECQKNWYMPNEYKNLDIAKWLLDQCNTQEKLQRVGQELLLYQERELIDLLKFLKYLVDTMRENKIVWGLGRGSSVSSYVLYLIGVHKIDSMYYDLDITEFLR